MGLVPRGQMSWAALILPGMSWLALRRWVDHPAFRVLGFVFLVRDLFVVLSGVAVTAYGAISLAVVALGDSLWSILAIVVGLVAIVVGLVPVVARSRQPAPQAATSPRPAPAAPPEPVSPRPRKPAAGELRERLQELYNEGDRIHTSLPASALAILATVRRPATAQDVDAWEAEVNLALSREPKMRAVFMRKAAEPHSIVTALANPSGSPLRRRMGQRLGQLEKVIKSL